MRLTSLIGKIEKIESGRNCTVPCKTKGQVKENAGIQVYLRKEA